MRNTSVNFSLLSTPGVTQRGLKCNLFYPAYFFIFAPKENILTMRHDRKVIPLHTNITFYFELNLMSSFISHHTLLHILSSLTTSFILCGHVLSKQIIHVFEKSLQYISLFRFPSCSISQGQNKCLSLKYKKIKYYLKIIIIIITK